MTETRPSGTANDAPNKGMPQANVLALKEWLSLKRENPPSVYALPMECLSLPVATRAKLVSFFSELRRAPLVNERAPPVAPSWLGSGAVVLYMGQTWKEAYELARGAAIAAERDADMLAKMQDNSQSAAALDKFRVRLADRKGLVHNLLPEREAAVQAVRKAVTEFLLKQLANAEPAVRVRAIMDIGLIAETVVLEDAAPATTKEEQEVWDYALHMWAVWKRGYALLGKFGEGKDARLYVYKKGV